jgi:hypothetical protein
MGRTVDLHYLPVDPDGRLCRHTCTIMPQARVETVDVRTVPLKGEFIESNLGTEVRSDGSVVARIVAQQYSFTPRASWFRLIRL